MRFRDLRQRLQPRGHLSSLFNSSDSFRIGDLGARPRENLLDLFGSHVLSDGLRRSMRPWDRLRSVLSPRRVFRFRPNQRVQIVGLDRSDVFCDSPAPIRIDCAVDPRLRLTSDHVRQPGRGSYPEGLPRSLEKAEEISFQLVRILEDQLCEEGDFGATASIAIMKNSEALVAGTRPDSSRSAS